MSVAIVLLAFVVLAAFLVTRKQVQEPTRYRATVQVLIPMRDERGNRPEGVPAVLLQGQQALAMSESTRQAALERLPEDVRGDVVFTASVNEGGNIMLLSASARDADVARAAADHFGTAYIGARRDTVGTGTSDRQEAIRAAIDKYNVRLDAVENDLRAANVPLGPYQPPGDDDSQAPAATPSDLPLDLTLLVYERNTLLASIEQLKHEYATLAVQELTPSGFAEVVERPAPERITPEPPSPLLPAAVIIGLGLLLAVAVPTMRDRLDHSINDAGTAATALGAPVLSVIGAAPRSEDEALTAPGTDRDSAYRTLAATSIATDRLPKAIVVTSPVGSTQDAVAANFAAALASLGLRVALVATVPRQSWFAAWAGTNDEVPGMSLPELLDRAHAGSLNGELRHDVVTTELANLVIIPPGDPAGPGARLDGLPPLLDALTKESFDVTVIAGPALLEDADATIFAWATRHVLWAVELGEVPEAKAREAASRLALAGVTPFGIALVGRQS